MSSRGKNVTDACGVDGRSPAGQLRIGPESHTGVSKMESRW